MLQGQDNQELRRSVIKKRGQNITRLENDNFVVWKWNLKCNLKSLGLYDSILSDNWGSERERADAMMEIVSSLGEDVKVKLTHCRKPFELYNAIEALYVDKTAFQRTSLLMKLTNFKFESTAKITQGISTIQELVARLKNNGENVSDQLVEGIVLSALPPLFRTFITVWKAQPEVERTLTNLYSKIQAEVEDNKIMNLREDKALVALRRRCKEKKPREPESSDSSSDDQDDESKDDDQSNEEEESDDQDRSDEEDESGDEDREKSSKTAKHSDRECYYCKKKGHFKANCFKRKKDMEKKKSRREAALIASCNGLVL